jgi:2-oxoglutarate ferredoxin oxidoreductase subunit beta
MLANMRYPGFPVALGIIRAVSAPTYDMAVCGQISKVKKTSSIKNVDDLLRSGSTWEAK